MIIQALILLALNALETLQSPIDNTVNSDAAEVNHKTQFFNDYDGGIFSDALTDTKYYNTKNTEAVQEKQLNWLSESSDKKLNKDQEIETQPTDVQNNFNPILRTLVKYFITNQMRRRRRREAGYVEDNDAGAYDSNGYDDYQEEPPYHFRPIPVF